MSASAGAMAAMAHSAFRLGLRPMSDSLGERNWRFLVILWTVVGATLGGAGWGGIEIGTLREQMHRVETWQERLDVSGSREQFAVLQQQVHDLSPRVTTLETKMGELQSQISKIQETTSGTNKMLEQMILNQQNHNGGK